MSRIIASTYEIKEKIGSGGGGIVYLGRHLRLGIPVVLKADKRTLAAKQEVLRREVDALKNLSHTYIPQVYDFVAEGDTVYTVMAYIEGESLDKPLRRGESFRQAQVITWACQLLEALSYLHSQPPYGILHGDIKPANIMLTPQGDIRLIDYNIALALGEEGSVRVGFSRGYASPEHYGLDYSSHIAVPNEEQETELLVPSSEYARIRRARQTSTTNTGKRTVLLDVRSDIYCLGATLYHLLTGVRPPEDAKEVAAISSPAVSPAVAEIIRRAMCPDPDQRYQSAGEMLYAFEHLHENDPRSVRHRRRMAVAACVLSALFLTGGVCMSVGLKQMERLQALQAQALADVTASQEACQAGDIPGAVRLARDALTAHTRYDAPAQKALTDALGVYRLSGGFGAHRRIDLPGTPQKLALSPAGTRTAVMTGALLTVYDTDSGEQLAQLAKDPSALADMVFLDEDRLLYAGDSGLRSYDLRSNRELWAGAPATGISVSADGGVAAAVYRDESRAVLYDTADGTVLGTVDFHGQRQNVLENDILLDPGHNLFALNGDGTRLAVSFADGALRVYDLTGGGEDIELYGASDYVQFTGGFCGPYFAFSAATGDGGAAEFAVFDIASLTCPVDYFNDVPFHVQADESGIFVSAGHTLVRMDPETWEDLSVAYSEDEDIVDFQRTGQGALVVLRDGALAFYDSGVLTDTVPGGGALARTAGSYAAAANTDAPFLRIFKQGTHDEARFFSYDPMIPHDEARVSADGETVMLFGYDRLLLFSRNGQMLGAAEFPEKDSVYDTQYRRDEAGSYLEVISNDGRIRAYSAADGSLLSERTETAPDPSLDEEFYTERYRIFSPLHGTPQVYARSSGEPVCQLEPDSFLTYVTELDSGEILTEYISADGKRYGLLLSADCEILAQLPDLCDVFADGTLYFDDGRGTLRQSAVYSLEELLTLAEE